MNHANMISAMPSHLISYPHGYFSQVTKTSNDKGKKLDYFETWRANRSGVAWQGECI